MRIRTRLIIIFLLFGLCNTSRADKIIYNRTTYDLYEFPLLFNSRFKQWNTEPIFGKDAKIETAFDDVPYKCTWIVQSNYIYLQSIKSDSLTANLQSIFPDKFDNGRVLADWIDTTLYAPYGKMLYSFDIIFSASIYEYELAFRISKGKVISVEKCDNTKTKPLKDERQLQQLIQNTINWENVPKYDSIKRMVYVQVMSADSLGRIDSVSIPKGVNDLYDKEAIRIVKTIPEWPVIYRHGKIFNGRIYPIIFGRSNKK